MFVYNRMFSGIKSWFQRKTGTRPINYTRKQLRNLEILANIDREKNYRPFGVNSGGDICKNWKEQFLDEAGPVYSNAFDTNDVPINIIDYVDRDMEREFQRIVGNVTSSYNSLFRDRTNKTTVRAKYEQLIKSRDAEEIGKRASNAALRNNPPPNEAELNEIGNTAKQEYVNDILEEEDLRFLNEADGNEPLVSKAKEDIKTLLSIVEQKMRVMRDAEWIKMDAAQGILQAYVLGRLHNVLTHLKNDEGFKVILPANDPLQKTIGKYIAEIDEFFQLVICPLLIARVVKVVTERRRKTDTNADEERAAELGRALAAMVPLKGDEISERADAKKLMAALRLREADKERANAIDELRKQQQETLNGRVQAQIESRIRIIQEAQNAANAARRRLDIPLPPRNPRAGTNYSSKINAIRRATGNTRRGRNLTAREIAATAREANVRNIFGLNSTYRNGSAKRPGIPPSRSLFGWRAATVLPEPRGQPTQRNGRAGRLNPDLMRQNPSSLFSRGSRISPAGRNAIAQALTTPASVAAPESRRSNRGANTSVRQTNDSWGWNPTVPRAQRQGQQNVRRRMALLPSLSAQGSRNIPGRRMSLPSGLPPMPNLERINENSNESNDNNNENSNENNDNNDNNDDNDDESNNGNDPPAGTGLLSSKNLARTTEVRERQPPRPAGKPTNAELNAQKRRNGLSMPSPIPVNIRSKRERNIPPPRTNGITNRRSLYTVPRGYDVGLENINVTLPPNEEFYSGFIDRPGNLPLNPLARQPFPRASPSLRPPNSQSFVNAFPARGVTRNNARTPPPEGASPPRPSKSTRRR